MIDRFQSLASRLYPIKFVLLITGLASLVYAGVVLSGSSDDQDNNLLVAFLGLVWSLSGYAFIVSFKWVPEKLMPPARWLARVKVRLIRGWFWLLALCFTLTTVAIVWMSVRLILILFR